MRRKALAAAVVGLAVVSVFLATAIAGRRGAVERETLVRARVWCEALVDRDALRYQEAFRRGHFRGRFDRAANIYREPSEAQILAQMPATRSCRADGSPSALGGDVYVPVVRDGDVNVQLRMRREAGFWVIYQVLQR